MHISAVHSFLVQAAKGWDHQPMISGTRIPMEGQLFTMLQELCLRAPTECKVEIMFCPNEDGEPSNEARSCLETYTRDPSLHHGRIVAERLQGVTTMRSGLGLLFLAKGETQEGSHCLVISRFPAEQGVVAKEDADRLAVEFMERVFMKNAKAYKSVIYQATTLAAGFEEGRAIDRQLSGPRELSNYWIRDFLASELRTTGPLGSKRLATALRMAVNATQSGARKQELISIARLLRNQEGKVRSARAFLDRLGVSEESMVAVERALPRAELIDDSFRFDVSEFDRHISYRMLELDTGAMLMAMDSRFDEVFHSEPTDAGEVFRYSTEGKVVDHRYRKRK